MTAFTPDRQVAFCRDAERCFFGSAPSIGLVGTAYGEAVAAGWMQNQLRDLSAFAGVKVKLTERQTVETAYIMLDNWPHYRLTEFMLFFHGFKSGRYGRFYGMVDPMTILEAMEKFSAERAEAYAAKRSEEERAARAAEDAEAEAVQRRYTERVPGAGTAEAAVDLLQYRFLGMDRLSDEELAERLERIRRGDEKIPTDAFNLYKYAYGSK